MTKTPLATDLRQRFHSALREGASLAPFTSARIGGPADFLVTVTSADALAEAVELAWQEALPHRIIGAGSNLLVSDKGFRGLIILNRAKAVRFNDGSEPTAWAESGAVFSSLANRCAARGLAGLEWAATVPGTVGGAVYGNAGAFGGDVASSLRQAELLDATGRRAWAPAELGYAYRSSILKRGEVTAVVLAGEFQLALSTKAEVTARMDGFTTRRKATQPPGASMGSMFKNPEGDFAGRLVEAAGLKGTRVGNAEISPLHGNFFVNRGSATAADVRRLIEIAREGVLRNSGVHLELEIELVGEW